MTAPFRYIAPDTEGALIRPGLAVPPTVCMSYAERVDGRLLTSLVTADEGVVLFKKWLADEHVILVFKNAPFDCAVLIERAPELMVPVFNAFAQERIRDIGTRQELLDIRQGRISDNGKTFVFDKGDWRPRDYSLAGLEKMYGLGDRTASKADLKSGRYRFAELAHLPLDKWPEEAKTYAKEDAGGTLQVYERQTGGATRQKYMCPHAADATAIVDETNQERAQWALYLTQAHGIRTDEHAVKELEARLFKARDAARRSLIRFGIIRPKKATADDVRDGKVDFYEAATKSRKATKKDVPGANQYIKDGRLYTELRVAMRWAQDKKRIGDLVEKWYKKRKKDVPRTGASTRHPTGQISTDKDTLYGADSRLLKLAADGGGVEKIINTYLPVLNQGTKYPVNVRYNVLVNSGRTSAFGQTDKISGEQSGCNIQNLPTGRRVAGTRECFVPRPGFVFSSVDYNTAELRALAQVCFWLFGKSRMLEVLNSGKDLHLAFAADMLHVSYEDAGKAQKGVALTEEVYGKLRPAIIKTFKADIADGKAYADRVEWCKRLLKRYRDCAKVANFGAPGGLGAESLCYFARATYNVILDKKEAYELIQAWKKTWPEMALYFSYINSRVGSQKELAKIVQFWSGRVRGNMGYCDACNTLFQGLVADGAKLAMFRIVYEMYCVPSSPLYGSRLVAFVHDEFVGEHPVNRAHEAAWRMSELAVAGMKEVLPDVLVTAEPALMERWYKGAELAKDANGRLIPWVPKKDATA